MNTFLSFLMLANIMLGYRPGQTGIHYLIITNTGPAVAHKILVRLNQDQPFYVPDIAVNETITATLHYTPVQGYNWLEMTALPENNGFFSQNILERLFEYHVLYIPLLTK